MRHVAIAGLAIVLAGCQPPGGSATERMQNPYNFGEIVNLSAYVLYGNVGDPQIRRSAQENRPAIAALYENILKTFDTAYGTGLGPAKDSPEFNACGSALHGAAEFVKHPQLPAADAESQGRELHKQINACRVAAMEWSTPAEVATFRQNLMRMTSGAMLVVAATMVAQGAETPGYMIGQEAKALLDIDNRP